MESFFFRYRNLLVLLSLLLAQIIGLAVQVRRNSAGRTGFDTADSSGVRLIRLWANAVVSPVEMVLEHSKTGAGGFWRNYIDLRHVRQQNQDLQDMVDRLRLEQAALLEDARQGQRLQAMLNFQQKYLYKTLPAQIIGTGGSDQSRVFTLDKGKNDGLARDMGVITADGIVGKVREVFPQSAQVLAINDQSSGAGVILETTRIRGILRGNAQGEPQIVGILKDQRIQPGEKVLTAGGDQIFPRGLPVGTVEKVVDDPDRDGFINVIVKPYANLDRLDEVMVITSNEPRFPNDQQKDLATSEQLKSADVVAIEEQKKASAIMAERLPGLTDANAPATTAPGTKPTGNGAAGSAATPTAPTPPKLIPPQHPDRFTPGHGEQPSGGLGSVQGQAAGDQPTPKAGAGKALESKPPESKPPAPGSEEKKASPTGGDTARPPSQPAQPNPAPNPPSEPQGNE
jgi:rod shape-determining protein MreC